MPYTILEKGAALYFHEGIDQAAALDIILHEKPDSVDGCASYWVNADEERIATLLGVTWEEFMQSEFVCNRT